MHYFVFPTSDTWISSGSNPIDGESYRDQNFGSDQILEIKKHFFNRSLDHQTRALVNFSGTSFTEMSQSIVEGDIPGDAKFYFRMYEAQGNSDLSTEYTLDVRPVSESWVNGTGKVGDNPKTTNGCSWKNRSYPEGGAESNWVSAGGSTLDVSSSVQSFSNESPDVEADVTDMVNMWLKGQYSNYGMLVRFSGSQETDETTFGRLKFFSKDTHTIYAPRLEVRWDGHIPITGSTLGSITGSLNELTMSGAVQNFVYSIGMSDKYKETEVPRFRFGARKQFIQKSFTDSYNAASGSYIPEGSGSYAIIDVATGEKVIDFSSNSKLSCDSTSNYFTEHMNGLYPDRTYKILIKITYDDEQERIYDNDFEFKLVR